MKEKSLDLTLFNTLQVQGLVAGELSLKKLLWSLLPCSVRMLVFKNKKLLSQNKKLRWILEDFLMSLRNKRSHLYFRDKCQQNKRRRKISIWEICLDQIAKMNLLEELLQDNSWLQQKRKKKQLKASISLDANQTRSLVDCLSCLKSKQTTTTLNMTVWLYWKI